MRYWIGGLIKPAYRQRLVAQSLPGVVTQAMRRCVTTRDGKILLVKNPKAACSTAAQLLLHYDQGSFEDTAKIHRTKQLRQGMDFASHHLAALIDPKSFKFTIVRDPLSRTTSAFAMFFLNVGSDVFASDGGEEKARRRETGIWALGYDPSGSPSRNFDIFLDYIECCFAIDMAHVNTHWKPQVFTTAHGHIRYDHVGKVETLRRDLETIQEKIGHSFPGMDKPEGPQFNRSRVDVKTLLQVTPEQRRKVRDLFSADYEAFGY